MTVTRWVPSRKAALVGQIESGMLTPSEAQCQFGLSPEELAEWKRALAAHGVPGLRVTRLQIYMGQNSKSSLGGRRYIRPPNTPLVLPQT